MTARFAATALNLSNYRAEKRYRLMLFSMTAMLVLPVLIILSILVIRGAPMISFEFLFEFPRAGMTEGGIYPALLGTIFIVLVDLVFAMPIGVAADIYLSE
ncbi:MAG: phosphate ABC transporter, permease protein PstA, partial [Bacteroidetes bacterium]|nr:phosphate ABC transporter, permease protein PstA [Bacteroidota bacterium]